MISSSIASLIVFVTLRAADMIHRSERPSYTRNAPMILIARLTAPKGFHIKTQPAAAVSSESRNASHQ